MVRTWHFHCWGLGLIPGWGTKILQATWCGQKERKKKQKQNPQINKYLNVICRDPHPALKKTSGILEHRRQSTFVIKFVVQWESIIVVVSVSTMAVVVGRPRSKCGSRQAGDAHGSCIPITQPTLPSKSTHSFNKYY